MLVKRPAAIGDATITACSVLGGTSSLAYFASPVTFARPSWRRTGAPMPAVGMARWPTIVAAASRTSVISTSCTKQRLARCVPRQLHLEFIPRERARGGQRRVERPVQGISLERLSAQCSFGLRQPPRLLRHGTERDAHRSYAAAIQLECAGCRHHCVFVGLPLPHFYVRRTPRRGIDRHAETLDELGRPQATLDRRDILAVWMGLGRVLLAQMKLRRRNGSTALGPDHFDHRIQRSQCYGRIRRLRGDAGVVPTEQREPRIAAVLRGTTGTGDALIARPRHGVRSGRLGAEIRTTGLLQDVATDGRPIA